MLLQWSYFKSKIVSIAFLAKDCQGGARIIDFTVQTSKEGIEFTVKAYLAIFRGSRVMYFKVAGLKFKVES